MKKINLRWLFVIIPVILIIFFVFFSNMFFDNKKNKVEKKLEEYTTKDGRVSFDAYNYFLLENKGEYDLYLNNDDKKIVGVFTYNLGDYEENSSKEILDKQVSYFQQTRKNMKLFKKEEKITDEEKTITMVEYYGKSDSSSECVYIFSVIDFIKDPTYVVYTNEVIVKKDYEENIQEMINILRSAKLK